MKVSFKDLGLVNTREMFAKAVKGGYAIPAFNFNNMEQQKQLVKLYQHLMENLQECHLEFQQLMFQL